jgi:hypothetical protein
MVETALEAAEDHGLLVHQGERFDRTIGKREAERFVLSSYLRSVALP